MGLCFICSQPLVYNMWGPLGIFQGSVARCFASTIIHGLTSTIELCGLHLFKFAFSLHGLCLMHPELLVLSMLRRSISSTFNVRTYRCSAEFVFLGHMRSWCQFNGWVENLSIFLMVWTLCLSVNWLVFQPNLILGNWFPGAWACITCLISSARSHDIGFCGELFGCCCCVRKAPLGSGRHLFSWFNVIFIT